MSSTSCPRFLRKGTKCCLAWKPRWSLPMAILMMRVRERRSGFPAGRAWVVGRQAAQAALQQLVEQMVQVSPNLLGAVAVDLGAAADRVGDVAAFRREQPQARPAGDI